MLARFPILAALILSAPGAGLAKQPHVHMLEADRYLYAQPDAAPSPVRSPSPQPWYRAQPAEPSSGRGDNPNDANGS